MFIIGITGPSGAGKGVVSECLKKYGFKVVNADDVYHDIISSPSECVEELVKNFGDVILSNDGSIDRKALGKLVFGEENTNNLLLLNRITHGYVFEKIEMILRSYDFDNERLCAIDAPLLLEAGLDKLCDCVISVIASRDKRARRVAERDGIDMISAFRRIDSQKPDGFYEASSDYIIHNDLSLNELDLLVDSFLHNRGIIK